MKNKKKFFNFNFLPSKERKKRENKKFILIFTFDIGLSIFILFMFLYFLNANFILKESRGNSKNFLSRLWEKHKKLKRENFLLNKKIKYYEQKITICKRQKILEPIDLTILNNIEKNIVDNLSLTNLKCRQNFFKLKGISNIPQNIYIYLDNLKKFYKLTGFQIKPSKNLYKFRAEFFLIPSL